MLSLLILVVSNLTVMKQMKDKVQDFNQIKIKKPLLSKGFLIEVVRPGFEPGQTESETVMLPLHHRTV